MKSPLAITLLATLLVTGCATSPESGSSDL